MIPKERYCTFIHAACYRDELFLWLVTHFFFPTNVGGLRGRLGGGLRDKPKKGRQTAKFRVSRETVVLRRWERSKQNFFGFVKRVDKG